MTLEQIDAMLSDLLKELDYDIWKGFYTGASDDPEATADTKLNLHQIIQEHHEHIKIMEEFTIAEIVDIRDALIAYMTQGHLEVEPLVRQVARILIARSAVLSAEYHNQKVPPGR